MVVADERLPDLSHQEFATHKTVIGELRNVDAAVPAKQAQDE